LEKRGYVEVGILGKNQEANCIDCEISIFAFQRHGTNELDFFKKAALYKGLRGGDGFAVRTISACVALDEIRGGYH
jgi:hypothetical protein